MSAHADLFPADWNHHSVLHEDLIRVLEHADCGWLQCCCALGFATSAFVATYPDRDRRVAMAETIAGQLIEAAESGQVPGTVLQ